MPALIFLTCSSVSARSHSTNKVAPGWIAPSARPAAAGLAACGMMRSPACTFSASTPAPLQDFDTSRVCPDCTTICPLGSFSTS
ncbi:hypothetical protein F2P44_21550 [Massilia sp. CCM 8695]|uniref:4Fe-4S ferredoxin-type domain-containing protein n=1 Tax=Massilia frigida TaxID=2609281 RepID=A0ABX0N8V6_9BURK|nr:hypothetical protein [Massilia frigida]